MANHLNHPMKLFIADAHKLRKSNDGKNLYKSYGMTFNTIEMQGNVVSANVTDRSANFTLSDSTGAIDVFCNTAKDFYDRAQHLENEISSISNKNKWIMNLLLKSINYNLDVGDIVIVVGRTIPSQNKSIFMAFNYYSISIESSHIWNEHVLNLYRNYYKKQNIVM